MTRLTNEIRGDIRAAASSAAFGEEIKAINEDAYELGERIWRMNFADDTEYNTVMALYRHPTGKRYLHTGYSVNVQSLVHHMNLSPVLKAPPMQGLGRIIGRTPYVLPLRDPRPILPYSDGRSIDAENPKWKNALTDILALANKGHDLDARTKEFNDSVDQLLASVTTVKKLLSVWPEASKYLPAHQSPAQPVIPINLVDKVNAFLRGEARV